MSFIPGLVEDSYSLNLGLKGGSFNVNDEDVLLKYIGYLGYSASGI